MSSLTATNSAHPVELPLNDDWVPIAP